MKTLFLILTFSSTIFYSFAQPMNKQLLLAEADELFNTKKYGAAFPIYTELLKSDPLSANLNYKIGTCYLYSRSQKLKAAPFLEKAIEYTPALTNNADPKNTDAPLLAYKLLGDAYCLNYKFDQAITAYEKYKSLLQERKINDPAIVNLVNGKIETCKLGKDLKELVALPIKIKTEKNGKAIDTSFRNCSSALSADKTTMIFTYKIPLNRIQKIQDAVYFEELRVKPDTAKQTTVETKTVYIPSPDTVIYVTTVGASVDGQILLTYRNEGGNGNLYITRLKNNVWSVPTKINKTSNLKGWEPNECISPDGNSLYFVSDRKEGYGGKDIYKCKKMPDGEWGKAVNLGPVINSPFDDEAPVIHPDGSTLFFSSNRSKPKEYFDNYIASLSDGNVISNPLAVGYPVDKGNGEAFFEVAADTKKVFTPKKVFSSKKLKQMQEDSLKEKENNPDDFLITFVNKKQGPLTILKGRFNEKGIIPNAQITVSDNETGAIQGVYHPDMKTSQFSIILSSGRNNNITYEAPGYLFKSENRILLKDSAYFEKYTKVNLQPVAKESKTILNNIFFEDRKGTPLYNSDFEINKVVEFLNAHPNVTVKLTNTIYTNEEKSFYKDLSRARVNAVAAELAARGISEERIKAKSFRKSPPKKDKKDKTPAPVSTNVLELEIEEIK